MIDVSHLTAAEREVLREALAAYIGQMTGTRTHTTARLHLGQRKWRKWQATELLDAIPAP